jgi:hypothetical protein
MTAVTDDTSSLYPGLPVHAEIVNVEHDLAMLRERRTRLAARTRRLSAMVTYGFWTVMAAGLVALAVAIAIDNGDAGAKLFLVLLVITIFGVVAWLFPDGNGQLAYWHSYPFRDQKEFLDHAIAVREARLKALRDSDEPR